MFQSFFSYLRNLLPTSLEVHLAKQYEHSAPLSDLITQINILQTLLIPPLHQSISYVPCETLKGSILSIKINYRTVCLPRHKQRSVSSSIKRMRLMSFKFMSYSPLKPYKKIFQNLPINNISLGTYLVNFFLMLQST